MFFTGKVLGIETSCDETSAAIVEGKSVLSNVVASQIEMHEKWGGVVPEAAARAHIESMLPVIQEALDRANIKCPDAIAITNRPGLVGALSVGVSAAKALATGWNIPIIAVHHLEGHLFSIWGDPASEILYPHLALIVSGGHTELVDVVAPCQYKILAETRDDAAGEAFDKGARLLGLGYPGGKAIQDAAESGNPSRYDLPIALSNDPTSFSFSGLKTAMKNLVSSETNLNVADAAASLQEAIVQPLVSKTISALQDRAALALVGGVAANRLLRARLAQECKRLGCEFYVPPIDLCTDNAAMIALAGSARLAKGEFSDFTFDAQPNAPLP